MSIPRRQAEALCDLADDAREIVRREIVDGVGYCPACRYHSSPEWECGCGYGRVRAALARLDGDAEGE